MSKPQAIVTLTGIQQATRDYEAWVRAQIPLIESDLRVKHQRMRESAFGFLRATFYRWVQLWPTVCAAVAKAPVVLGVGDIHIENFGTWRDIEGRLVWGVNDFDEATALPYTNDLVRLTASAFLAIRESNLSSAPKDACEHILAGYEHGLRKRGTPFVLAENHRWLGTLAASRLRDATAYWQKLDALPTVRSGVPKTVRHALEALLPEPGLPFRIVHRQAGLGSLGRRRFLALADYRGGKVAREAKELRVSSWHWQEKDPERHGIAYEQILSRAVRVPDPFVSVKEHWLLRRLAPDCCRIELASLPRMNDELRLLHATGWELANIHLGTKRGADGLLADLRKRGTKWLHQAAEAMVGATLRDWKEWCKA